MAGLLPGVGHALALHNNAVAVLRRAEREQGPFVQVNLGFGQWYLFCFGTDTFELLKHKGVGTAWSRPSLAYLVGKSVVALDGAPHRRLRSALNQTFSPRGLAESSVGRTCAATVRRHVDELFQSGGGDLHDHLQKMTLDVILRVVGVTGESLADWHAHYRKLFWGIVPIPYAWPGTPRYFALRATAWINDSLLRLVRRARAERGEDLIHALAHSRDEAGQPLSDTELVDNLRFLFIAGHETTATTMTWATAHLAQRPDLVRRLQDEVAAAGSTLPLTLADARRLPLCEAVFREAARLYVPAWFLERTLTEDIAFNDTLLPSGTRIGLCPPLWGRDPARYPAPDSFDPDRWIGQTSAPTPFELAAFGGGPHFCLGYHLAWLESMQYLAALASGLRQAKKRLRLPSSRLPGVAYFPLPHPSPAARVLLEQSGT